MGHLGQGIDGDLELVWSLGFECPNCGNAEEIDGHGFPPDQYRTALLTEYGDWTVSVTSESARVPSAQVLMKCLEMPRREAVRTVKNIPGVIWTGTKREAEWLLKHLKERDVTAIVAPSRSE